MSDEEARLPARRRHWLEHIRACEVSGQTMVEYAAEHGFEVRRCTDGRSGWCARACCLGRVVFMPTFDSEHGHLTNAPNPNHVPVSEGGRLLTEVVEVLEMIAAEGLALATGHSSPDEVLLLIRAANDLGIERIIVTHPSSRLVGMSVEAQREAAGLGALLEYPIGLALPGAELSFEAFVTQLRDVGAASVVLSTDLGQVGNPVHTDGLNYFLPRLREAGFTDAEIDRMTRINPAHILGLE